MPDNVPFSRLATALINVFENRQAATNDEKIVVNALISKVASFYEKFRTAMDYGSEETIPRRAIERMLKRMLILEQDRKKLAEDLVRELIWAGYFPNATVPESIISDVATSITLFLKLKDKVTREKIGKKDELNEFIMQILSCEILKTLIPNNEKDAVANFMFQTLRDSIKIDGESEQTKDIQVFLAVRKNFAKDDIASLHHRLFKEIFGKLTQENFDGVASGFAEGYSEIKHQLSYPKKERVFNHIKKKTPPFLILYDILIKERGNVKTEVQNEEEFKAKVYAACDLKYKSIRRKVQTGVIRSFIFILFTKAILAILIEGTYESIFLGGIEWGAIALNTVLPPGIMILVGATIRTPSKENSEQIYQDVKKLLFEEKPMILNTLVIKVKPGTKTITDYIFSTLWLLSICFTFGAIWYLLGLLDFNILSKGIFIFFIAIISFLSYRIHQTAHSYTVVKKQTILTPVYDFFFVPIIKVGRSLTEGFSQINFLLLAIDFIIEAPFKGTIGFFEQWFLFAASKREELE